MEDYEEDIPVNGGILGEEPTPATQADLDHLKAQVEEMLLALADNVANMLNELDARLEKQEEVTASLAMGYAEQTVFIEALVGSVASGLPDKRKELIESIQAGRDEMLKLFKEQGADLAADEGTTDGPVDDMGDEDDPPATG